MNPDIRFNQMLVNLNITNDKFVFDGIMNTIHINEIQYYEEPQITLSRIKQAKKGK